MSHSPNPFSHPHVSQQIVGSEDAASPTTGQIATYTQYRRLRAIKYYALGLSILVLTGFFTWALLLTLQFSFKPVTPANGWVIGPSRVFIYFVAIYIPAFWGPLVFFPRLKKRWDKDDIRHGFPLTKSNFKVSTTKAVLAWIVVGFLFVLCLFSILGSLRGFTIVDQNKISVFRLWKTQEYKLSQVRRIDVLDETERIGNTSTHGPCCFVRFDDQKTASWGHENGLKSSEVAEVALFISKLSRVPVTSPDGTVPRY